MRAYIDALGGDTEAYIAAAKAYRDTLTSANLFADAAKDYPDKTAEEHQALYEMLADDWLAHADVVMIGS